MIVASSLQVGKADSLVKLAEDLTGFVRQAVKEGASLDQLERLLLQVTRKNEARGYERFRDLFEAIVAYNE